ncbi:MAG TPA: hypothetical protein PL193_11135 [Xanthobacteraceae bacterium]|nr:hypothetical protein [Xanthobacteraceae bacterium]
MTDSRARSSDIGSDCEKSRNSGSGDDTFAPFSSEGERFCFFIGGPA